MTKRQQKILVHLQRFIRERGYPPTVRELASLVGRKSTAGVQKLLNALERKGYITKVPGRSRGIVLSGGVQSVQVPVVGRVVAGTPILSEENIEGYVALDRSMVPNGSFLLMVQGESMIGDHIQHGDLVLVRPQPVAQDGDIVVAMVEGETTVKRFRRGVEGIELVPAHPGMKPFLIREGVQLRIVGKVVAVLRFLGPRSFSSPMPGSPQGT